MLRDSSQEPVDGRRTRNSPRLPKNSRLSRTGPRKQMAPDFVAGLIGMVSLELSVIIVS